MGDYDLWLRAPLVQIPSQYDPYLTVRGPISRRYERTVSAVISVPVDAGSPRYESRRTASTELASLTSTTTLRVAYVRVPSALLPSLLDRADYIAGTSKHLPLLWNDTVTRSSQRTSDWALLVLAQQSRTAPWTIYALAAQEQRVLWSLLGNVFSERPLRWLDYALAIDAVSLLWEMLPYVLSPGTFGALTSSARAARRTSGLLLTPASTRAARDGASSMRPAPARAMQPLRTALTDSPASSRPARTMLATRGG